MASLSQLPNSSLDGTVVNLTLLSGGCIHLDGEEFVQGSDETLICPSMSWLLTHRATGTKIIFDLGLRKDAENYIPPVADRIRTRRVTISVREDVFDSLERANVDPTTDIDAVIFSHLHYDHVGDSSRFSGPQTKFIVGPGTTETLLSGPNTYPTDQDRFSIQIFFRRKGQSSFHSHRHQCHRRRCHQAGISNTGKLSDHSPQPWTISGMVRVGTDEWMYLAGDTAHDVRVYRGTRELAVYPDPKKLGHLTCAHADKEAAHEHMLRVRKLDEEEKVEVVLSHDFGWFEEHGKKWMV